MTRQSDCTLSPDLVQLIADQGLDALPKMIRIVINHAMQAERSHYLNAEVHERTAERRGYANGSKPKTVTTRMGQATFAVPQVRDSSFYPQVLEKGLRSERALTLALAEMYVQGVSTRKVAAITAQVCGLELTATQVSRAAAQLDAALEQRRTRPLAACRYLWLDARYEKVRIDGQARDAAVLIAMGLRDDGKRVILGLSVAVGEHEAHWRQLLQSLVQCGLTGVQLIVSDAHEGLQAARRVVFGGAPWQRCQFHLQQNAQAYAPRQELKAARQPIFARSSPHPIAPTPTACWRVSAEVRQNRIQAGHVARNGHSGGLDGVNLPAAHRTRLRTVNALERLNQDIRRRTRVVGVFPNEASCLRLVTALAMETSDEWEAGKVYLSLTD